GVVDRRQILDAVLDALEEGLRHLVDVVGEVADAAVPARRGALAELVLRNLLRVTLRHGKHVQPLLHQHFGRQARVAELDADEIRDVFERLREYVLLAARDDRNAAHAHLGQLGHRLRAHADVDRLEVDADAGQVFLDLDAARAALPPVDAQVVHHITTTPRTPCSAASFFTRPDLRRSATNSPR